MEVASSDAKSKWDTKTQALFKHRGLSSLRKKMRNVRRREDKDKVSTTTTTTTSAPDVSAVPVSPLMPVLPFDSLFAAASQASYAPQMFDPMAQYLPPPASFLARASSQQGYMPPMTGNPIYLLVPKPAVIPHLPHHPFDPMNANALLAHMAQLHYDMLQQNQRQDSMYDETDPRDSSIGTNMGKSKSRSLSSRSDKEASNSFRRNEELTRIPMMPDVNGLLNFNQQIADKYGEKAINNILDRIHGRVNEKKEFGYGDRTNHMIDRISDRADKDRTDYSFGFPGREIDSRESDSRHSDNDVNSNQNNHSNNNNNERDANGNYLSSNTTPAPNNSNRNDDHQGGY